MMSRIFKVFALCSVMLLFFNLILQIDFNEENPFIGAQKTENNIFRRLGNNDGPVSSISSLLLPLVSLGISNINNKSKTINVETQAIINKEETKIIELSKAEKKLASKLKAMAITTEQEKKKTQEMLEVVYEAMVDLKKLQKQDNEKTKEEISSNRNINSCFDEHCDNQFWKDEKGEHIEAHGGGVIKDMKTNLYFWYGEGAKQHGHSLHIRCYVSASLSGPWRSVGEVITAQQVWHGLHNQRETISGNIAPSDLLNFKPSELTSPNQIILERPKVLYNSATNQYVMWFHLDATHSEVHPTKQSSSSSSSSSSSYDAKHSNHSIKARRRRSRNRVRRLTEPPPDMVLELEDDDDNGDVNQPNHDWDQQFTYSSTPAQDIQSETYEKSTSPLTQDEEEVSQDQVGQLHGKRQRYWLRRAGVAVSNSPQGPFKFLHALKPDGLASLDLQLFEEDESYMENDDDDDIHLVDQSLTHLRPIKEFNKAVVNSTEPNSMNRSNTIMSHLLSSQSGESRKRSRKLRASDITPLKKRAYLIRSVDNMFLGISRLSDDYTNTTSSGILSKYSPALEGMAVFKLPNGTYYALLSHMTGWEPNPLVLLRSQGKSLQDPKWISMGNPTHDPKSYNCQPTMVLPSTDKRGRVFFMLLADNWVHGGTNGLADATYVWLPLILHNSSIRIQKLTNWSTSRPFATVKWEDSSKLHALAMSDQANVMKGVSSLSKRGGRYAGGESWSALDDPHAGWCSDGHLLDEESPVCCSAFCGASCGGYLCNDIKEIALNLSLGSTTRSKSPAAFEIEFLSIISKLRNKGRSQGGIKQGNLLVSEYISNMQCCPENITRKCTHAEDTACLIERAPSRRFNHLGGSNGLDWSPKEEKLLTKEQRKQEKIAMLKKIDNSFFSKKEKILKPSSSSSSSSSTSSLSSSSESDSDTVVVMAVAVDQSNNSKTVSSPSSSAFLSSLRSYDSTIITTPSSSSSTSTTNIKSSSSSGSSSRSTPSSLGHPLWSNRLVNKGRSIVESSSSSSSKITSSKPSSLSSQSRPRSSLSSSSSSLVNRDFGKNDPGVGGLIKREGTKKSSGVELPSSSSSSSSMSISAVTTTDTKPQGQMQWWQKNKVWEKSGRNKPS